MISILGHILQWNILWRMTWGPLLRRILIIFVPLNTVVKHTIILVSLLFLDWLIWIILRKYIFGGFFVQPCIQIELPDLNVLILLLWRHFVALLVSHNHQTRPIHMGFVPQSVKVFCAIEKARFISFVSALIQTLRWRLLRSLGMVSWAKESLKVSRYKTSH